MSIDVRRGRTVRAAVASLAALGLLTGPASQAAHAAPATPAPASASASAAQGATHTVTLITGDVVRLVDAGGGKQVAEVRRPRRAPGGVRTQTIGKDLYVWPDEAMPLVAANAVDRRLFNVSLLVRGGYDDARRAEIPLIATYGGARAAVQQRTAGTTKVRDLPSVNGAALKAQKRTARTTWDAVKQGNGPQKLWLDGRVEADLEQSTAQIGAPAAWAAGLTGTGVRVAVLDTGVDLDHPDLAGRVSATASFVPGESADDGNGHGTHTISTVGGSGAASAGHAERGVAPGADLIAGKVLADDGYGEDSWVIAGMEWAVAQHAKVVSMSLGNSQASDGTDPVSQALNALSAQSGTLFVVAAGNNGNEASMGAPGVADAALTVGAVDADDRLAYFSSRGPRFGDYGLKPDIAAPGVDIAAAKAGGNATDGWYTTMSGTSMATPHVAGAAAILASQHPDWTAARLKDTLMSSSRQLPELDAYAVGAGRVDVAAATRATVSATGSAYFGFFGWPHAGAATVERAVTYSNSGDDPVTLELTERVAIAGGPYDVDPGADAGTPAADGMFGLSTDRVTVPAHGTATVTAVAKPAMAKTARRYLGQIVATGGGQTVRTQVGLYTEDERHNLHLSIRDRDGRPAAGYLEVQAFGQYDPLVFAYDGDLAVRLRAGTYSALTLIPVSGGHGPDSQAMALLGDPEIVLDRDRTVTLDARQAREVSAQLPGAPRTEDRVLQLNWYRTDGAGSTIDEQLLLGPQYDTAYVLPTKRVTRGAFEYETRWRKAYPMLTLGDGIPFLAQAGSSAYDGRGVLDVVRAGTGAADDYRGRNVRGKAVVVTRSDAVAPGVRAQAAADAGAALLIVVNDGPGKLMEWVGTDEGALSAVPVVTVTARTGAALPDRLRIEGVPDTPYVYDLVAQYPGRIPADLSYRPRPNDLARVDMRFHGSAAVAGGEYRWNFRPYRQVAVGFLQWQNMPGTRTDWVSSPAGTSWMEDAFTGPGLAVESRSGVHAYAAGSRQVSDWFAPVTHPRNGSGYWWSSRQAGFVEFNVQPWTDSGTDHGGSMQDGADERLFRVWQDGELMQSSQWPAAYFTPSTEGPTTFVAELRASRDASVYRLTTATHTRWTVRARPVAGPLAVELLPLLQLDYTVGTDLAGDARAGRQSVGVRAVHLPGVVGAGSPAVTAFAVSFDDGATWRAVPVSGGTARFTPPRDAAFVSLRVTASDSAGNAIEQEVIRAYGLGDTRHRGL
ncbi:S8 family serine peptidase [Dactylosporangium sp. NBC_01737]|uniref:S8 family serine peptidase n=1 Tax=Dactylosporangium sp. NBC_01737 TaxID=2975959 RepID=UPI002E15F7F1|nr:S8 family serine peptidase [Dactylosporangium sp. NBC_01737]